MSSLVFSINKTTFVIYQCDDKIIVKITGNKNVIIQTDAGYPGLISDISVDLKQYIEDEIFNARLNAF